MRGGRDCHCCCVGGDWVEDRTDVELLGRRRAERAVGVLRREGDHLHRDQIKKTQYRHHHVAAGILCVEDFLGEQAQGGPEEGGEAASSQHGRHCPAFVIRTRNLNRRKPIKLTKSYTQTET